MDLQERLDRIPKRISEPDFLANKGVANEVRYYVFDYDSREELIVRERIETLIKNNNPEVDGFQIVEYDLYKLVLELLKEKGYLEKCIQFEEKKGRGYMFDAIIKMLRLTNENNLIVNRIVERTPDNAVVFLTGIGKCFPIVRSHNILNNLYSLPQTIPVVMFFPGEWNGQVLNLFGTIKDDNYYRAFPLIDD